MRRVVPVVHTVVLRPRGVTHTETNIETQTFTPPPKIRLVTTLVPRRVRVVERRTVTVAGKSRVQTRVLTVTRAQPPTTVVRTETDRGTDRSVTVTISEPVTVLRTTTDSQTVLRTTTVLDETTRTETLTTTAPAETITNTVTVTTTVPRGR